MARKKQISYINGRLSGNYLNQDTCNKLESLRRLDEKKGYVKELKHIIFDLPMSDVEVIKQAKSSDWFDLKDKHGTLENIQTVGVAYMYFAKRLILGDSVGLGKTVEVAGLCNLLENNAYKEGRDFRFLFLTNKTLIPQVRDELIKFTGNYVEAVYGEKAKVQKFIDENTLELKYSVVGVHSLFKSKDFQEYLRGFVVDTGQIPFDLLVVDESGDILANHKSQMYSEASYVASMFERVVLLNATPFEKNLLMFYNQLDFIDPTFLPTRTYFSSEFEVMDYSGPYPMPSGKYKNAEKFKNLIGYRYLSRSRKSSGGTMIGCSAEAITVPLSKAQRMLLEKTAIPRMVYDCPSYFNMGVKTNLSTTPKLKALVDLLKGDLKDVGSILIYTWYRESQDVIKSILDMYDFGTIAILNGGSSDKERERVINEFKLGTTRILITNVQKGLNFGNCNHCVFYSYDSSPSRMVQFEGRMTRSLHIVNKHVYVLLSNGDEKKSFFSIVSDRAKASDMFAGSDFSCILSLLTGDSTHVDIVSDEVSSGVMLD